MGSAFSAKSRPMTAARRPSRASRRSPWAAVSLTTARSPSESEKATSGWAMARRLTTSTACCSSVRSALRNLSRAGVAKKRSRTSTRVPGGCAAGWGAPLRPPSTARLQASAAPRRRLVSVRRLTAPIEGSASPRKPRVAMRVRSSSGSLEVAWRSTASANSPGSIPPPSSTNDEAAPAVAQHRVDAARPGVERVLDQLLEGRRRALDHLARGDLIDQIGGQQADGHAALSAAARRTGTGWLGSVGLNAASPPSACISRQSGGRETRASGRRHRSEDAAVALALHRRLGVDGREDLPDRTEHAARIGLLRFFLGLLRLLG